MQFVGFESQGHTTICHDIRLETKINDVLHTPITYICVPTPSLTMVIVIRLLYIVLRELYNLKYKGKVCVKAQSNRCR